MIDEYTSNEAVDRWFATRWQMVKVAFGSISAAAVIGASIVELWKAFT